MSVYIVYRIRPNYRTYTIRAHASIPWSSEYSQCTFCLRFYKGMCCGYPFEFYRLVDAIQMSIYSMCFIQKIRKKKKKKLHNKFIK